MSIFDNPIMNDIRTPYEISYGSSIQNTPHFHGLSEFIYLLDGEVTISTPFSTNKLEAGDIFLTCENIVHSITSSSDSVKYIVFYTPLKTSPTETPEIKHLISRLLSQQHIVHHFKAETPQAQFIGDIINKIYTEDTNKNLFFERMINSYIEQLNLFLLREGVISNNLMDDNPSLKKILPVLDFINKNYNNPIKVSDVSRMLFFSGNHFERIFKRATSMTFTEYLNYVRISKSQTLLKETSKTIGDIANEVGFSSQIYFCRCFKKHNNCTPTEYRKSKT